MSEFERFLQYVEQYPSIGVVVVGVTWSSLEGFFNRFPNIQPCVLSNLHLHEFNEIHQLIVVDPNMTNDLFFSRIRHQNEYDRLHIPLSKQPKFDTTLVFLDPSSSTFCLGAIEGRNIIEQLLDCPIPQNNPVPSVWEIMVENYANQVQRRRLNNMLEHDMDNVSKARKKM